MDPTLLAAAVGPNAAYYLDRWAEMDASGKTTSWNWPACMLSLFWFAYRKMWLPMVGVFAASFALSLIAGGNPQFAKISWLFSIGITFVTGAYGNYLYRQQVEKLIEETAPLGRPAQLEALAQRGGVSKIALYLSIGVILAASALSFLAATGWTPRTAQPGNGANPTHNRPTPATPPPGGIPGYDDRPQGGAPPQQPPQPPIDSGQPDQGTGDQPPDDGSFQQDEARQDEIQQPE